MKKILKYIRTTISLGIWTYLYMLISGSLYIFIWNFNIFSADNWNIVYRYWESGGVIHTWKDYLLLLFLIAYIPFWYIGWKYFHKLNFLQILLWPINKYNQHMIEKYGADSNHIVLKYMGTGGIKIEEEIEIKSKPKTKIETDAEVNKIRSAIAEKINSVKHK